MAVKHLSKSEFDQAVNAGEDLVVVDFFATWCGPCKMLTPVVESMAETHPEVHFYKVDIDEEIELATRFQVMSVPTLLYKMCIRDSSREGGRSTALSPPVSGPRRP